MIENLTIANLGVIDSATVELGPGLTVFTGETGAGKTMVVTALGLLAGARADTSSVRQGAKQAVIESRLLLGYDSPPVHSAEAAGAQLEDGPDSQTAELIVARTIGADSRSRAHVGGRQAPISVLSELGEQLLTIHGQSDQLRLKSATAQREALDAFAGKTHLKLLGKYQEAFQRLAQHRSELSELEITARERVREAENLQQALAEIAEIEPGESEDEQLRAESLRLENSEELRRGAATAHAALRGEEFAEATGGVSSVTELLAQAKKSLESAGESDPDLAKLAARISEIEYLIADIGNDLASYLGTSDEHVPARLDYVQNRRDQLSKLTRKYAPTINEVLDWAEKSQARLDTLGHDDERIAELSKLSAEEEAQVSQLAAEITASRKAAAHKLISKVDAELAALAMPQAHLHIALETSEPGPHGADKIEIQLQPHPDTAPRALGKGASGGELSRVMLALEVVLADVNPVPTFVFDEVDAGVGGKAAAEIGKRLATLAKSVQVLVVTHLPQVAAFADHHHKVEKSLGGVTSVLALESSDRVSELARMLAGQEDSDTARAHAQELLEFAQEHHS